MSSIDNKDISWINSTDYHTLELKLKELDTILEDLTNKLYASRKLRFAEVDIEAERESGRLQPDEMYLPQHLIDTNIRREQSPYVQYITQSPRAVICVDSIDPAVDLQNLETDLTKKLRYDGWQLPMFANIDNFQQNGYSIMEVVFDLNSPGHLSHEMIQYGDFAFLTDTRDLQAVEMTSHTQYFTKTRMLAMCGDPNNKKDDDWDRIQVERVIKSDPITTNTEVAEETDTQNRSLYKIKKVMFRVNGIVQVGWCCPNICDDWLRKPRPLYLGDYTLTPVQTQIVPPNGQAPIPQYNKQQKYESDFPYYLYPYLISENNTISQLKGRVFLDQDVQEGVTSLMSSTVTQARRAAGLYFSKDVSDPNDDLLMQKNIFFKPGCIINGKVTQFQLTPPDSAMFTAINMLVNANANETSQVNFAVANRKDSRKTAREIQVASQQAQVLSTVQVVLFSLALKNMYTRMVSIIVNRVKAGLIQVNPQVRPLYERKFIVKPSGDADVIERQQLIQTMMQAWPVMSQSPAAMPFMIDLIQLMFPLNAPKYIGAIQQSQQQQNSQQSQMMQQGMILLKTLATGIVKLAQHPEWFSDSGRLHSFPIIEHYSEQLQQLEAQINGPKQQRPQKQLR